MRKTLLAALVGAMLLPVARAAAAQVPPGHAPSAPLPDGRIRTEATVVVTGEQPGPGLWLVRNGARPVDPGHDQALAHQLVMAHQTGRRVIANAQEVI